VRIDVDFNGMLRQVNRGLRRSFGSEAPALPTKADTAHSLTLNVFDASPWNQSSDGFRNFLEGWAQGPGMHNLVHVWVGGDMLPATSPNDPVFFLNHCNVDRIWEAWMQKYGRIYVPPDTAPIALKGHRLNDILSSLISPPTTPSAMLNVSIDYVYDSISI
jgi:tyrosinase